MNILADADDLRQTLERIAVPHGGDCLFSPLPLTFVTDPNGDDAIRTAVQSQHKSAFVQASVESLDIRGDGKVVVDSAELLDFLSRFNGDVELTFGDDAIAIDGAGKQATIYPHALEPAVPGNLPTLKDGIIHWRGEDPATTVLDVDADALHEVTKDAGTLGVDTYPLAFDGQNLEVALGSLESKHNRLTTTIPAKVEADGAAETVLGADFGHIVNVLDGPVELQFSDGSPVAVVLREDGDTWLWIAMQLS